MYQTPPKRHKSDHSEDGGPPSGVLRQCNSEKFSPQGEARRGRPRATLLSALILEGSTSPSNIKCKYCGRVFPREKSLQAHLRTHTGEKPYGCDYPRCSRRFAQSGQLKTHQRLHTGEKPFICTSPNCTRRFTHANRHCPDHPDQPLKRLSPESKGVDKKYDDDHNAEVREWLINWDKRNKNQDGVGGLSSTPKKSIFNREDSAYSNGSTYDPKNSPKSELDDSDLSAYNDQIDVDVTTPKKTTLELPKKRWLREAYRNQNLWDSTNGEDLASPLNWNEDGGGIGVGEEPPKSTSNDENQSRPSVLVCVQNGKNKEISNDEIQGAIALVELKNSVANTTEYKYRV